MYFVFTKENLKKFELCLAFFSEFFWSATCKFSVRLHLISIPTY